MLVVISLAICIFGFVISWFFLSAKKNKFTIWIIPFLMLCVYVALTLNLGNIRVDYLMVFPFFVAHISIALAYLISKATKGFGEHIRKIFKL